MYIVIMHSYIKNDTPAVHICIYVCNIHTNAGVTSTKLVNFACI